MCRHHHCRQSSHATELIKPIHPAMSSMSSPLSSYRARSGAAASVPPIWSYYDYAHRPHHRQTIWRQMLSVPITRQPSCYSLARWMIKRGYRYPISQSPLIRTRPSQPNDHFLETDISNISKRISSSHRRKRNATLPSTISVCHNRRPNPSTIKE